MDFAARLLECEDAHIGVAVLQAILKLFDRDIELLRIGIKEETIASLLAHYLDPYFPELNVDVEYSLMGEVPKMVTYCKKPQKVYPDIIVHVRNNLASGIANNQANVLAIELKKDTNTETTSRDIAKLRAYRRELGYQNALFIRLGTGHAAGTISECEWVDA
jgi:Uma2 family endonuclease